MGVNNGGSGISASGQVTVGGQTATIINPAGQSSFLQLLTTQQLQLAFGTTSLTWTSSTTSAVVTINHGLGRMPQAIWLQSGGTGNPLVVPATQITGTTTTTQFQVQGLSPVSGTFTIPFYWVAVG